MQDPIDYISFVSLRVSTAEKTVSEKNLRNTPFKSWFDRSMNAFSCIFSHSIGNRGNNNSTYFSLVILSRRSKCITTYYFPGRQMQEAHLILKSRNWLHIPGNQKSEISQKTSLGIRIQLIFPCSSCPSKYISIRISHWRHTMVDGAEFWIICR